MKRTDRSEKFKEQKLYKETVVKSALQKHVYGEPQIKDEVIKAIQNRVLSFSKAMNLASIALNGLLKELFDGKDCKSVVVPDIFKATFVRQLMLGTDEARKPILEVSEYHDKYPFLLPKIQRCLGDRNIYSHGATQFVTNLKNSLVSNFESRIKQYLKRCQDIYKYSQDEKTLAYYNIMGWKVPFKLDSKTISNERLLEIVYEQRLILNLQESQKVGPIWLKSDEAKKYIIKQWAYFNRFYESQNLKTFLISPIASIRAKFITIDTQVLFGLMKELKMTESKSEEVFAETKDEQWHSIFKIQKLLKKSPKEFTYTVNTDGLSVCTHFRQLKETKKLEEPVFDKEKDRILSCDPGRVNIYSIVENILGTDEWKSYILTRKQYYNNSGVFEARDKAEKWNLGIKDKLEALSKVSLKGVSLKTHSEYIETFVAVQDDLWAEYTKNRWARQRLELYGGKKRTFAKFFNMIQKAQDCDKEIKMLYGAAKFAPGAPNELSIPSSRAFRECVERFIVKIVNEFRTSKVHYDSDSVLQRIENKIFKRVNQENTIRFKRPIISKKRMETLRGLLWYSSTIQKESKFVDRDINAAKNIYRCGMASERPQILTQTKMTKKLEFVTGKAIRTLLYL